MRRSPLLDLDGAVGIDSPDPAGEPDLLVPAHFGNPLREQALLAEGRAVVALARDVVAVSGPDRLSWLTTLSSQVLTGLAPGDGGAEALLLDAQGHITHALAAVDDGETLFLVTQAGDGPVLADFLDSMRFMLAVQVCEREELAVLGAHASGLAALETTAEQAGAGIATWHDPWPGVVPGGTSYDVGLGSQDHPYRHPGELYRAGYVIVAADQVRALVTGLAEQGLRPAGVLAWEALRVEAGRPRWAREVDARAIPHELDWLRTAVHLTKGCFPGQETIARTLNLGRPPRRLTILQLDGLSGELPSPGDRVLMGERAVGAVTSVVRHHDYGPMALALLRRAVPVEAALTVEVTQPVCQEATSEAGSGLGGGEEPGDGGRVVIGRVDAAQELLVGPQGKAQASPAERPGAGLRTSLLRRPGSDR
ncbi:CAF17-like 4Fe-4S cluster assembly/insertion protein YgfZ [Actinomyces urogenitalis]|uniref:CAF17-like 4Fe-4S cluster assembly/insertion protein YgfZ n=1 Tax=Actinomyces urogenitalis TaxID=103621 RepID=UPI00242DEAF5|nr:folate-binding protein [Actinomyces urogenitalis]MBS5977605.1 folate-binding protein YgfZ [Actinomyces urogenitalis]